MQRSYARALWIIGLTAILAAVWVLPLPIVTESTQRTFEVDARQFEFAPGRLEVNQGDVVTLTLTASDVVHGFYLDGYGIQQSVQPGRQQIIRFIADQPGKFRYRCSVSCGTLHPFMIGELVVNANQSLWRALATLAASFSAILFYLWHFGGKEA